VHDLGIKDGRLIKFFDLEDVFFKHVLLDIIEPLEEGISCSSLEEISEIITLGEGLRCSSLEEISTIELLKKGERCSSQEEIEDTVPVRRGVGGPSPET
jgi:hypothetical protein